MTTPTIAFAELAEKGADVDVLRQMVQFMAQRLMDVDVEGRCGAAALPTTRRATSASTAAMASENEPGRRALAPSNSRSPSCARAATSRASWSPAGRQRRR